MLIDLYNFKIRNRNVMTKQEFKESIDSEILTGIKAGTDDHRFLDIWMVIVDDRIFARSWGIAERSWYNTFLNNENGKIKSGDKVFNIKAKIPEDLYELEEPINNAYMKTYDFGTNAFFAKGLAGKKHVEKTMEFILEDEVV
ncbi:hypothetical protein GCM10010984_18820 [Chishuiella changwenlii]|uniref:DUF2255 family protein n=2 Tax=Chishuiella changwenlii TaxID=1434701 RepID=A0ABQ1TTA0_9FLAO|nr:hypothetical protein GCM10010984_18820 [Chishuiella changwenlii]